MLDACDVLKAQIFGKRFTKVYIDVSGLSGYRSLLDVIVLPNIYATVLIPKAIVVKSEALKNSGALKNFAAHCIAWLGAQPDGDEQETQSAVAAVTDEVRHAHRHP